MFEIELPSFNLAARQLHMHKCYLLHNHFDLVAQTKLGQHKMKSRYSIFKLSGKYTVA